MDIESKFTLRYASDVGVPSAADVELWNQRCPAVSELELPMQESAVVLCGGPSSSLFQQLGANETLICVNRVSNPAAAYHILASADVLLEMLQQISQSTVIVTSSALVGSNSTGELAQALDLRQILAVRTDPDLFSKFKKRKPISADDYAKINLRETPYLPGASSGVFATAFALALGAKRITQFGMDGWTQFVRTGQSPYADGAKWAFEARGDEMMDYQESLVIEGLKRCKLFADEVGAEIINANPESSYQAVLRHVV